MAKRRKRSRSGSIAVPAPPTESESVRISKISNGYLIEKSGVKRGKYFSHQEYSAGRPVISASAPTAPKTPRPRASGRNKPGPVPLREVGYLNRSR